MNKHRLLAAALVAAGLWAWRGGAAEDSPAPAAPAAGATVDQAGCTQNDEGSVTCPFDKGPDTVDVSAYPKEQQDNYAVFAEKCSKCHTLARPINAPYALPEEWQAYVVKMRHKPRSGIDDDAAKSIIDFLTYDSSVRKKDLIEKKRQEKKDAGGSAPDAANKDAGNKDAGVNAPTADDKTGAKPKGDAPSNPQ